MSNSLYKEMLQVAIPAALQAGKAIMEVYNDPTSDFGVEKKADNSPLTLADRKGHEVIAAALANTPFPLLSEEGRAIPYNERAEWDTLWIVDPLDGTKEFIKRNGEFTVNIALVKAGVPVLGVIYVPVRKELYFGMADGGAYKLIDVDAETTLTLKEMQHDAFHLPLKAPHEGIVVVASRSHQSEETMEFIEKIRAKGKPVTLISSGSSLKICLVAEGSADVYPRFAPTMEWDTAAGDAIARAAGCRVTDATKATDLCYNKTDLLNPWFIVQR